MKIKMAERSLFAILMRKPWWISIVTAVVVALAMAAMLPRELAPYGVSGGFPFLVIGVLAAIRQLRTPSAARIGQMIEQVGAMSWREFSARLERGYRNDGYEVKRHAGAAADFEILKAGRTFLVSARRWKAASTGVEPLRELVAATDASDAQGSVYIALGQLTGSARQYANQHQVQVLDLAAITRLLQQAGNSRSLQK